MFQRYPDGSDGVLVSRWTAEERRDTVIRPGQPIATDDVVDVSDGPEHRYWLIETSVFRLLWPSGFTVESPQDPADNVPFYLLGAGDAAIFAQGPVPTERLAGPDALVGPGQTVVARRTADDGTRIIELTYEHDGDLWWQGHWAIRLNAQRTLVLTGQARATHSSQARAGVEEAISILG